MALSTRYPLNLEDDPNNPEGLPVFDFDIIQLWAIDAVRDGDHFCFFIDTEGRVYIDLFPKHGPLSFHIVLGTNILYAQQEDYPLRTFAAKYAIADLELNEWYYDLYRLKTEPEWSDFDSDTIAEELERIKANRVRAFEWVKGIKGSKAATMDFEDVQGDFEEIVLRPLKSLDILKN